MQLIGCHTMATNQLRQGGGDGSERPSPTVRDPGGSALGHATQRHTATQIVVRAAAVTTSLSQCAPSAMRLHATAATSAPATTQTVARTHRRWMPAVSSDALTRATDVAIVT